MSDDELVGLAGSLLADGGADVSGRGYEEFIFFLNAYAAYLKDVISKNSGAIADRARAAVAGETTTS